MLVSKDYYTCDDAVVTIEGVFDGTEAEWDGCTSHTDKRIEWEQEPEDGWVYKDFSFRAN
jgi:hypothetical protein